MKIKKSFLKKNKSKNSNSKLFFERMRLIDDFYMFSDGSKYNYRYFFADKHLKFFKHLEDTCAKRILKLSEGKILYRSQIGGTPLESDDEFNKKLVPHPFERMKPLKNSAREGRVNPKGIPCLYLSDRENTAITELRPWKNTFITSAKFEIVENIELIDFSRDKYKMKDDGEMSLYPEDFDIIWAYMNNTFSEPVSDSDTSADYVPTQIIAEKIKNLGYDGIVYKSSVGLGRNFALFNLGNAKCVETKLKQVKAIRYQFIDTKS